MTALEYRERIAHGRAQAERYGALRRFWRARVAILRARLRRLRRRDRPYLAAANLVRGGDPRDRLLFAAEKALRHFRPYYSEQGAWDPRYALTNVPEDSFRSDCSWWFTALYRCCGLPDPNGAEFSGGYTGTLLEHGRIVSRRFAETHAGCAVIFGTGTGIHVGISTGRGATILQHGQAPVEGGSFDEFGPGVLVRYRDYLW